MANDCAPFGIYGMSQVKFSIDGSPVIGFDEGDDCIQIEPTTQLATAKSGADGTTFISYTQDQSATVTIRLLPNSPHNQFLRNKVARVRNNALTGIGFPIDMTDLSSRETGGCTNAVVMSEPTQTRGANVNSLEWMIFCPCWQNGTVLVNQG